ncbi:hypothetical protein GEV33_007690 [Tenebrio molitor]|uniref:Uncharacterized protein n=1 Tax=Tenebrio molitor TaxID=7067 RepID=A0A8J6HHW2_TENMO|nr:hypothetical protein GEV33_007690 [Tenebrio molitor]
MIKIRIERGETIKHRNECGEPGAVFGLLSWLVVRSVPDCERGGKSEWLSGEERVWRRRGSEEGEAGRRVQEVRTQTPRSGFTDLRPKVRRSAESNSTPGFRRPAWARGSPRGTIQVSRDVDRTVTIKASSDSEDDPVAASDGSSGVDSFLLGGGGAPRTFVPYVSKHFWSREPELPDKDTNPIILPVPPIEMQYFNFEENPEVRFPSNVCESVQEGISAIDDYLTRCNSKFEDKMSTHLICSRCNEEEVCAIKKIEINSKERNLYESTKIEKEFSVKCGASQPHLLGTTLLRKQVATMAQLLAMNDNEIKIIAKLMGHSYTVHEQVYRQDEHLLQLNVLGKISLIG